MELTFLIARANHRRNSVSADKTLDKMLDKMKGKNSKDALYERLRKQSKIKKSQNNVVRNGELHLH